MGSAKALLPLVLACFASYMWWEEQIDCLMYLCLHLITFATRETKLRLVLRWMAKLKPRTRRANTTPKKKPTLSRNTSYRAVLYQHEDIYYLTGMTQELFDALLLEVQPAFDKIDQVDTKQRKLGHIYDRESRLLMTLYWLRMYPSWGEMADLFRVSSATCRTEVFSLLPHLCEIVQQHIKLPEEWTDVDYGFAGAQFIIDCTSHYRDRVHPGQELYYRGDKHAHFLTAQVWFFVILLTLKVVISMYGLIYSVVIALGHNNDQGVFNHSFNDYVQKHNIVGLSDRGYVHQNLVTPSTQPTNSEIDPEEWSTVHSKYRYPVEVTNAFIKNWKFAADRVKQSPEIQGVALIVIYGLTNLLTKTYPTLLLGYNKHK
jgi:hypothetical protein